MQRLQQIFALPVVVDALSVRSVCEVGMATLPTPYSMPKPKMDNAGQQGLS